MKQNLPSNGSPLPGNKQSPKTIVLSTVADTTWRVFVPVTIFVGLGIWADVTVGTKPWLTLSGMVIGLILAGFLIMKQIKELQFK